jgi:hypothetical protein
MKPTSFFNLPRALQEILLWEMNTLDYDPYESSRAECIHDILCGNANTTNYGYINNFYQNVSVDHLQLRATQAKESHLHSIEELNEIIG